MQDIPDNRIATGFADTLSTQGFKFLEYSSDPAFAVDASMRLAYVNRSYIAFGCANGGLGEQDSFSGIGTYIGDVMNDPLRQFYLMAYGTLIETDKTWNHEYDCSSPTLYRRYLQSTFPLAGKGLVVINRLLKEQSHTVESEPPIKDYYLNENQLIPQCSHCHKVRRHGADVKWDWVTEWVASPPQEVTHSLCEPCADYYYGELKLTLTSL